jgi:hypothetical protein
MTDIPPLCRAAIEAGKEIGLEYREDVNALPWRIEDAPSDRRAPVRAGMGGIGYCQQTRGGRARRAPICARRCGGPISPPTIMIAEKAADLIRAAARA